MTGRVGLRAPIAAAQCWGHLSTYIVSISVGLSFPFCKDWLRVEGTGWTQACSMRHSRCVVVLAHDRLFVFRHDAVCMHGVLYMYVLDLCVCA